jgi:hypothetical protein
MECLQAIIYKTMNEFKKILAERRKTQREEFKAELWAGFKFLYFIVLHALAIAQLILIIGITLIK